jgi:hypothetical protein
MKEEMQTKAVREWKRKNYIKREARLTVKSGEITTIKAVPLEEKEDVVKEMGE